jgi:hypothetical protein
MSIMLTERAKRHIEREISKFPELIPVLAWADATAAKEAATMEGWWLFFCGPGGRPQDWMVEVGSLLLSLHPEMQSRLEGKTLDFSQGHLQEL